MPQHSCDDILLFLPMCALTRCRSLLVGGLVALRADSKELRLVLSIILAVCRAFTRLNELGDAMAHALEFTL